MAISTIDVTKVTDRIGDSLAVVGKAEDRTTATTAFNATRGIHCNIADTYELTFVDSTTAVDMVLTDGVTYPFCVTNVLNTSSAAIDAGDITLLY